MARGVERHASRVGRTTTRVRYPETDRMGVAHHTHFLVWFELGRTELMRELGCPYAEVEDGDGILFPVAEAGARYVAPARYDEVLEITTRLVSAFGARVRFEYEVARIADGARIATGFTVHAATGRDGRPRRLPEGLRARLAGPGSDGE
jgi:acyl-CoA thioester hydrolase